MSGIDEALTRVNPGDVILIGIPSDENSSFMRGAALAPARIREALHSGSTDLDVLDPAYAPGVSHHEPGGLSTRDLIRHIHTLRVPIVGADIVEFNPTRDPVGITAMAAAKLLKEIAACMLSSASQMVPDLSGARRQ